MPSERKEQTVFQFNLDNFKNFFRESFQASYLYEYLSKLNAKVLINEAEYIDRDYMIDYQKFYSRSFERIDKFTRRIHFFSSEFTDNDLKQWLLDGRAEEMENSYLGFVVVKPIQDPKGNPLIGRTLLQLFPTTVDENRKRFYISSEYDVSLFGLSLKIKCVPFQAQDRGVSACATVALWTAFQSLPRDFGYYPLSPAEITETATMFPSIFRVFPQEGLTLGQMINCIKSVGLDVETVIAADSDVVTTAVKAYTYAGVPLIGTLRLKGKDKEAYHAVVIVGYQHDVNGNITELYVHDDQIGPYSRVTPRGGDFRFWENEWKDRDYKEIKLEELLIPVYHKIRLPFWRMYKHFIYMKNKVKEDVNIDLYLTTVQRYKNFLLKRKIKNKVEVLKKNFPRFLWIERIFKENKDEPIQDDVFDGTAIDWRKMATIEYIEY
jgi:hypothetical protein